MDAALLMAALALLNCFRGRGAAEGDRFIASGGMAIFMGHYAWARGIPAHTALEITVYGAVLFYLWAMRGWGKYFAAFHGRYNWTSAQVVWIDRLGERLVPYDTPGRNRKRGTLQMSLRGLYLYPMFAMLAWLVTPWALAIGVLSLLQGPAYGVMRYVPERHAVPLAEYLWGACMGALIAAAASGWF